jgi:putative hydrolase of the HAD superfamily
MSSRLTTILFDAAGTLIYLPQSVGTHYREVALRFGFDFSAQRLDEAFVVAWKAAPPRQKASGPRPDDDKGWWCSLVREVMTAVASPAERETFPFEAYFETLYSHFTAPGVWLAYPETKEVLATLQSRGYQLGVVSNFDRRLHPILSQLDLGRFFTSVIISSEVGVEKPDPAIFARALAALHATPDETLHVGDDPEKDWGARKAGLRVFELQRPGHSLRDVLHWVDSSSVPYNGLAKPVEMS